MQWIQSDVATAWICVQGCDEAFGTIFIHKHVSTAPLNKGGAVLIKLLNFLYSSLGFTIFMILFSGVGWIQRILSTARAQ